jgi:hypothetical protein
LHLQRRGPARNSVAQDDACRELSGGIIGERNATIRNALQ